ncbi:carbon-nitrogen hydrolase family protein [Streptomyces sp. ACT015]|uniref:carbon-nitrogen hydrolase family protein n=1 Tax=Streptomyces sp. ACT015 TaxID=3134807 RepID=UPI003D16F240
MKISGLQTAGTPGDVEANLRELDAACARARAEGAELLVTTELFLTGYDIGDLVRELARTDLLSPVRELAARHGLALVVGLPEHEDGAYYNSAFFVGPGGEVLGRHRKSHLFGALDRRYFTAGDRAATLVDFGGLRIALLICYDVEFPETVRAAAAAGADLVAVPTAQMEPFAFVADHVLRVRAWENQVYLAYVDHVGVEGSLTYVGRSCVVAPSGEVLDRAEHGTRLVLGDVDPKTVAAARAANPYLDDRRPELYVPLSPAPEDRSW